MRNLVSLTSALLLATAFCLINARSVASEDSTWNREQAIAAAEKLEKQMKEVRKELDELQDGPTKQDLQVLRKDVRFIGGHAQHLASGLKAGNSERTTSHSAKALKGLVKSARSAAAGKPIPDSIAKNLEAAEATADQLIALYGSEIDDVGAGKSGQ